MKKIFLLLILLSCLGCLKNRFNNGILITNNLQHPSYIKCSHKEIFDTYKVYFYKNVILEQYINDYEFLDQHGEHYIYDKKFLPLNYGNNENLAYIDKENVIERFLLVIDNGYYKYNNMFGQIKKVKSYKIVGYLESGTNKKENIKLIYFPYVKDSELKYINKYNSYQYERLYNPIFFIDGEFCSFKEINN